MERLNMEATHQEADLVIKNARQILTMTTTGSDCVGCVSDGVLYAKAGKVLSVDTASTPSNPIAISPTAQIIDARGMILTPGLVDPHTHPVFAGERSHEFAMKSAGKTYLDIHHAGGGIMSTVRATRSASFETLQKQCHQNLTRLLSWGVTTCEAKSGYALHVQGELRLLEVLKAVREVHPVEVETTLLGAHAIPPEYKDNREAYVALVAEEMIPRAAERGLARFCDAYCDEGAFTVEEVRTIFTKARAAGLDLRLHAEQFTHQNATALAAEFNALSADHLEAITPHDIERLAASQTVAVLLPGAALSCRLPWPPAKALLAAGVPVALGTDLNPGTSLTAALPLMMSIACMQMQMSCEAAWRGITTISARALGRTDIGRLAPGSWADIAFFDAPDYRYIPYHFGENHCRMVMKRGKIVWEHRRGDIQFIDPSIGSALDENGVCQP